MPENESEGWAVGSWHQFRPQILLIPPTQPRQTQGSAVTHCLLFNPIMETPQTAAAASLVNAAPETISNDTDPATDDQDAEEEAYLDTIDANPDTIEDYGRSQFRARALVVALEKLVKEAAASPDSPSASASRMEHDGYWRKVFTQTIIPTVVADDSIENSLFDPPRNKLGIVVACEPTGGLLCCPCDMPNSFLPTVEVEAAEADRVANGGAGVGKRALLEGLTAALYGTSEGKTGFIGGDGERFVLGR